MSENMKAAIYHAIEDIRIEERPMPVPGPNDVLVKNIKAGICGSDVTAFKFGGNSIGVLAGREFGHEMLSVVWAVGGQVSSEIKKGMRVFVNPMTCKKVGRIVAMMAGAFSQYVLVENAEIGYNLYPIPDNVTDEEGVLVEPFCVANHGVNMGRPAKGEKAVIFGAGPIGLAASQSLLGKGIKDIVVVDIADWRVEKAKSMGVAAFNPQQGDLREFLLKQCGETSEGEPDVDLYIDAAGVPSILTDFLFLAKAGARLSVIAVHKKRVEILSFC